MLSVSRCGQEILERTACTIDPANGNVLVRMEVGFPANGRTINSGELIKIFFEFLPECVKEDVYKRQVQRGLWRELHMIYTNLQKFGKKS